MRNFLMASFYTQNIQKSLTWTTRPCVICPFLTSPTPSSGYPPFSILWLTRPWSCKVFSPPELCTCSFVCKALPHSSPDSHPSFRFGPKYHFGFAFSEPPSSSPPHVQSVPGTVSIQQNLNDLKLIVQRSICMWLYNILYGKYLWISLLASELPKTKDKPISW